MLALESEQRAEILDRLPGGVILLIALWQRTRERLDGGCLNVYTTRACSAGGLIVLLLHALFGRLRQAEDFVESRASALRVRSRKRRLLVATDGEVNPMDTPLEFRIRRRALEVLVP